MSYNGPILQNPTDQEAPIIIYNYVPSLVLGVLATTLFALIAIGHGFWLFKFKGTRIFEFLITLGCALEIVGYIFRILSNAHPFRVDYFVGQYFLIVCAPVTFSAALYLALAYAIKASPKNATLIPFSPRFFVSFFIVIDVVTTILQIAGASLIGVAESDAYKNPPVTAPLTPSQANAILLAGLAFQVASFTLFLALLTWIIIQISVIRSKRSALAEEDRHTLTFTFLALLYLTSGMVYTRTVFRLAETASGLFSYASSHESLFGIFEFAPVWTAMAIWAVIPLATQIRKMQPRTPLLRSGSGTESGISGTAPETSEISAPVKA